jgi:hypothetical protein
MKSRSFYLMAAIVALLVIAATPAIARASSTVRNAPFYWESESTLCSSGEGVCTMSAAAEKSGRIMTSATRGAEKFTYQSGLAQALGVVSDQANPPRGRGMSPQLSRFAWIQRARLWSPMYLETSRKSLRRCCSMLPARDALTVVGGMFLLLWS